MASLLPKRTGPRLSINILCTIPRLNDNQIRLQQYCFIDNDLLVILAVNTRYIIIVIYAW